MVDLDLTDQGILYLLRQDARNNTTSGIGEQVGVSSTTVGNRISKLEDKGIITGYQPTIDYKFRRRSGFFPAGRCNLFIDP